MHSTFTNLLVEKLTLAQVAIEMVELWMEVHSSNTPNHREI